MGTATGVGDALEEAPGGGADQVGARLTAHRAVQPERRDGHPRPPRAAGHRRQVARRGAVLDEVAHHQRVVGQLTEMEVMGARVDDPHLRADHAKDLRGCPCHLPPADDGDRQVRQQADGPQPADRLSLCHSGGLSTRPHSSCLGWTHAFLPPCRPH